MYRLKRDLLDFLFSLFLSYSRNSLEAEYNIYLPEINLIFAKKYLFYESNAYFRMDIELALFTLFLNNLLINDCLTSMFPALAAILIKRYKIMEKM